MAISGYFKSKNGKMTHRAGYIVTPRHSTHAASQTLDTLGWPSSPLNNPPAVIDSKQDERAQSVFHKWPPPPRASTVNIECHSVPEDAVDTA